MTGNRYSNTLVGDAGDDILYDQTSATNGFDHDVLYGGLGNDTLQSLYGADLLDGGAGDDLIRDFGVGTIVFGHGYGHDTLVAHDASLARSIRFNADVSPADLKVVRAGADVVISLGVDDSLTVTGFYPDPTAAVSKELIGNLQFADGTRIEQGIVDALAAGSLDLFASRGKNLVFGSPGAESLSANSSDSAIYGLEGNDSIAGSSGADILDGGAGVDTLVGADGDDTYMVDDAADVVVENAGAGADSVYSSTSYALAANVENLILTGTDASSGTGNELANWMQGNAAGNTLDGGAGADSLLAGAGDDLYIVDDLGDFVVENAAEGSDTVHSSVWYTLTENTENLVLTGTAAISGYGNSLANWMQGNAADNTLDGRAGADSMLAGWGNDTYFVDDLGDLVVEDAGQGIDSVYSSVSYTLTENTENLVLTGGEATNGYGNGLANWMQGNAAANLLDGGAGADSLLAGAGNDTYMVDDFGDFVVENPDEGLDTVYSSVSYTLRANTENLVLTGSAVNGYGNSLGNWMHGNALDNLLDGGAGADGMQGDGGNDTYIVDDIADVVTESAGGGIDTVYASVSYAIGDNVENMVLTGASVADGHGNALANWMQGNDAANLLAGGEGSDALNGMGGADTLDGGGGDDVYGFDRGSGSDLLVETGSSSGDAAQFGSGIDIDQLWFTQTSSDLLVQVIGTSDYLTVKDWYNTSSPGRVDVFRTSDGHALQESNVQSLVDAMASFAPPASGETHLSADYQSQLGPTIAASWQ